jgi:hypothetical protein
LGFVSCPFDCQTPLLQRTIVISFDPCGSIERCLDTERLERR